MNVGTQTGTYEIKIWETSERNTGYIFNWVEWNRNIQVDWNSENMKMGKLWQAKMDTGYGKQCVMLILENMQTGIVGYKYGQHAYIVEKCSDWKKFR